MKRDLALETILVEKYVAVSSALDGRARRLWASAESRAIGYGGDPMSLLCWMCKSRAKLAAALTLEGWSISSTTVGRMLNELGYRLQSVNKRNEGKSDPDRNAQFEHINATAETYRHRANP